MPNKTEYRKCPKCGLNYITGAEAACAVCVSAARPYRGGYCRECGCKCGAYTLCRDCCKKKNVSANERRASAGYRTDNGMLGARTRNVCEICGAATYGRLCGKCFMAIRYGQKEGVDK